MANHEPKFNWAMLGVLGTLILGAIQLGSIQQQVVSTTMGISEAKLATATLAAQAVQQQQVLAEANTILRERVARLEEEMEQKNGIRTTVKP